MKVREPETPCGLTVLIVDDDPVTRTVLGEGLLRQGIRVAEAGDGEEGLAAVAQRDFDVIFMDIIMPVKDGIATIVELRRRKVASKIIAISSGGAEANFTLLEAAKTVGANFAVRKPFTTAQILNELPEMVRRLAGGGA